MQPSELTPVIETLATKSLLDQIAEETARMGARYMPTLTVEQFTKREKLLRELKDMLVPDVDYGTIPGTKKPTLLLPGAQKLCTFFGYVPHYDVRQIEEWDGANHGEPLFYYDFTCVLLKDGKPVGEGRGSCNSWEAKYRYRVSKRVCPSCGIAALIEGKQWKESDPKQWVCYEKKGGCKSKFSIDDDRITSQAFGRVANPDFADVINTCQKMGQKRAYVAATLSATGASQYFTQDMEDAEQIDTGGHPVGTQEAANHVRDVKIADNEKHHNMPPVATASAPLNRGQAETPAGGSPEPKKATAVPAEVMALWNRSGKQEDGGWPPILDELRSSLWELVGGDQAQKELDAVIEQYKPYGGPCAKETFYKRTLLDLWKRIEFHKRNIITDDDIPKNMGGTFEPEITT